jgi:hypothetical protein
MVSKITIFEPHFDGAQFGPASLPTDEPGVGSETPDADVAVESKSRGRPLGRSVFVIGGIVGGLLIGMRAIRRIRTTEPESVEIEERSAKAPAMDD